MLTVPGANSTGCSSRIYPSPHLHPFPPSIHPAGPSLMPQQDIDSSPDMSRESISGAGTQKQVAMFKEDQPLLDKQRPEKGKEEGKHPAGWGHLLPAIVYGGYGCLGITFLPSDTASVRQHTLLLEGMQHRRRPSWSQAAYQLTCLNMCCRPAQPQQRCYHRCGQQGELSNDFSASGVL